jgi:hypothetical protein
VVFAAAVCGCMPIADRGASGEEVAARLCALERGGWQPHASRSLLKLRVCVELVDRCVDC